MADPVIRLDRSRAFSECRGERTPDDPHYRVHFLQGGKMAGKLILLPFDSNGDLVPDDGKTEPYAGINSDGKPVTHRPLYDKDMRAYLDAKKKKMTAAAAPTDPTAIDEGEGDPSGIDEGTSAPEDEVNFVSWLRGEARYQPHVLRAAAKKRYHKTYQNMIDLVEDLVLDEKIIAEDELSPTWKKALDGKMKAKAA
jgi:hypothetical protein